MGVGAVTEHDQHLVDIEARWSDGHWVLNHATWTQADKDVTFLLAHAKRLQQELDRIRAAAAPEHHESWCRYGQNQESCDCMLGDVVAILDSTTQ